MTGKTTRYWDCCKPSCPWPDKAFDKGLVTKPVKTCQKDGYTVLGDVNSKNACDNGGEPAYVCIDNTPWAVNATTAYGFAAASIQGSDESKWCCACYKLVFTSGPVAGQTMVVQVTNTGGDLGANHFDLQIQGSGVGIFDGCSSQYPNTKKSAWGEQYGGVGSRNDCYNLPWRVQPGCLFRFDWFKAADNPAMKFSQVACPPELSAKTQCARK